MNRQTRAEMAQQTLHILNSGQYQSASGNIIDISQPLSQCLRHTTLLLPTQLQTLLSAVSDSQPAFSNNLSVIHGTTLNVARQLALETADAHIGVLNFASAKNPGGGFLGGSQAQEESLARSSALFASLSSASAAPYYAFHREQRSCFYSDRVIISPDCPVFRDDEGNLLEQPYQVKFMTCAAPNAGAIARNEAALVTEIPAAMALRVELLLAAALNAGCRRLILGAWGCGVFANDPQMVAQAFARSLGTEGRFGGRFEQVVFAIRDSSASQSVLQAFVQTFARQ